MGTSLTVDSIKHNREKIEELINFFSETITQKRCKDEIVNIFHKISFYSHDLFINEEFLMQKYDMPILSEHISEHRLFTEKIVSFQKEFERGKPELCVDLFTYLKIWYRKHVLNSDQKIMEYMKNM